MYVAYISCLLLKTNVIIPEDHKSRTTKFNICKYFHVCYSLLQLNHISRLNLLKFLAWIHTWAGIHTRVWIHTRSKIHTIPWVHTRTWLNTIPWIHTRTWMHTIPWIQKNEPNSNLKFDKSSSESVWQSNSIWDPLCV